MIYYESIIILVKFYDEEGLLPCQLYYKSFTHIVGRKWLLEKVQETLKTFLIRC